MLKKENLIFLIHSLSKSEKRYFRLYSGLHGNQKEYMLLFDIIEKNPEPQKISAEFNELCPSASLNNTANYLFKVLLKSIRIQSATDNIDIVIPELIADYTILLKMEMYEECNKLLTKAIQIAQQHESWQWLSFLLRKQLDLFIHTGFSGINENKLIAQQNMAEKSLKQCLSIQEHANLYELIMLYSVQGKVIPEKIQDLSMLENQLFNQPRNLCYEVEKLHLLFQSIYFQLSGDNQSAVRTLFELNDLFERNQNLWNDPPEYYIQHLKIMIFTLRELGRHDETGYFLNRLKSLKNKIKGSAKIVEPLIYSFQLLKYIDSEDYLLAQKYEDNEAKTILKLFHDLSPQLKAEILFVKAMVLYGQKRYKESVKTLFPIISQKGLYNNLRIYQNIRLFHLIVCFDMNKFDYLKSEIRSFERMVKISKHTGKSEKIIFRFIRSFTNNLSYSFRKKKKMLLIEQLEQLRTLPDEKEVFRYFNYIRWAEQIKCS